MISNPTYQKGSSAVLLGGIGAWAAGVALLSTSGALSVFKGAQIAPVILLTIALPVVLYARLARIRSAVDAIGLRAMTAVHVIRYLGAAWIFSLGAQGLMPPLLVSFAGWGDVIAATAALIAIVLPFARWRYIVAHVVSLADFSASLCVGLILTFSDPQSMAGGTQFPVALILFFIVGFFSANSIICLGRLLRPEG